MASTTGPDLSAGRAAVEALMDDACVIVRPGSDTTLDPVTLTVNPGASLTVYDETSTGDGGRTLADEDATGGMCMISDPASKTPAYRVEGGAMILNRNPEAKIPVDAPLVIEGDLLTVTSSRRDPQLPGHTYRVAAVIEKTFAISRRIILEGVAS